MKTAQDACGEALETAEQRPVFRLGGAIEAQISATFKMSLQGFMISTSICR